MIVIGELINSSRKSIAKAIETRDTAFIQDLARKQEEAGAHYIDVNAAVSENEIEAIKWLVEIIQEVVNVPLCVDSPSAEALDAGLSLCKNTPLINSITAEKERWDEVLPLVKKYKAKIVALCMDEAGMPNSVEDRVRVADILVSKFEAEGIPQEDIFLDPIVKPLGVNDKAGMEALESSLAIRNKFPQIHIVPGLSNISFGLPERRLLNRVFMVTGAAFGMDAFILDPLDKSSMSLLAGTKAVLGKDEFCMEFITKVRAGKVQA
ncbi:methyltetrahydrofolate cobalamin methyltransferase [Dethiobacter alkaliphilus]|uniref:methyltetrahydrofolate cobalamin methyltransferase n=1 Tax=Dethiobacter alkaliphilus TaxID=427926 RepID=UPI002226178F|nr:methyltetrahydrofolate cobalamin methyltransferase [Dethiobacter alkaliphilus]MCW3489996.1 methyltetrahydrofolate cobalamin methyltransferase [Dethiobacter alkaliphilus]